MEDFRNGRSRPRVQALNSEDERAAIAAAKEGDRDAFAQLVEHSFSDVYGLAVRLCGESDAPDVVQDAYVRAFRAIGSFRGDAAFSTWMYRITANVASTQLQRRRARRTEPLDVVGEPTEIRVDYQPDTAAVSADLRQRADRAIAALPPRLRAVVVLRDVYDLSHVEIAEQLGLSVSAAKVRLHRARRLLRASLGGEELFEHGRPTRPTAGRGDS